MLNLTKKLIEKNFHLYLFLLLIFLVIIFLFEVITPFCIAFIIAYLTNPIKKFLDKYVNKTFSSFISIIAFILFLVSILLLILPIIFYQIHNLIETLPLYISEIEKFIREINNKYLFSEKIKNIDYTNLFKPITRGLINSGTNILSNSIEFITSFLNILLIIVVSFYLSLEFNKIKTFIYKIAKKSNFTDFPLLVKEIDSTLSKFIRGQMLVCITLSVFYATGLFLVDLKFGILLGMFAGLISFIPYVGSFLGGGLTIILGLSQFGISSELFMILIIFLIGQLSESYFLTPKLVGEAIKLNPLWIIFALLTGAYLSGFVGVLISLPAAAILGVLIRYYFILLFK